MINWQINQELGSDRKRLVAFFDDLTLIVWRYHADYGDHFKWMVTDQTGKAVGIGRGVTEAGARHAAQIQAQRVLDGRKR